MKNRRKRGSLPFRKIVPNMVTSGNLLCGMMALFLLFHGRFVPAAWLVFMAVFFDCMDGKVARSLGGGTQFGLEFDSLADVVSFGVVPAMLMYVSYINVLGLWGVLAAAFFALCGALASPGSNVIHLPVPSRGSPSRRGECFSHPSFSRRYPLIPWRRHFCASGRGFS